MHTLSDTAQVFPHLAFLQGRAPFQLNLTSFFFLFRRTVDSVQYWPDMAEPTAPGRRKNDTRMEDGTRCLV